MLSCRAALNHFQWAMINTFLSTCLFINSEPGEEAGCASLTLALGKQRTKCCPGFHETLTQNSEHRESVRTSQDSAFGWLGGGGCQVRIHIFIRMLPPQPCVRACAHAWAHVWVHAYVYVYVHVHKYVQEHVYVLADMHLCVYGGQRLTLLLTLREDFSLNLELTDLLGKLAAQLQACVSPHPKDGSYKCPHSPGFLCPYLGSKLVLEEQMLYPEHPGRITSILPSLLNSTPTPKTTRNLETP